MTETTPAAPDENAGDGYSPPDTCGVGLLDDLKCEAKGVEEQAKYNAQHATELKTARTSYDNARIQYRKARVAATKTYEELGTQLDKILDQLRCLIDDKIKVRWLNQAFATVSEQLAECPGQAGCYLDDTCDFDDLINCPPDDVPGAIKKIEERVAAAKKVFDDLVQEPTELPKRVTARQTEVKDIVTAMATDSRSVDFKSLYAKALVTKARRDNLWRGFDDTNAYVDCLCRALLCQVKGYDAVSHLTKRQAVDSCYAESAAEKCKQLSEHTDVAVMEEYERIKASHRPGHGGGRPGGYRDDQQGGGDYPPREPGGDDYPPREPGGDDYPPREPDGDYPPREPGGGDYPPREPSGDDYPPREPSGDDRPPDPGRGGDYPPREPGGDYPPQEPGGGYGGRGRPPDQDRAPGYSQRGGRPDTRRPRE